MKKQHLKTFAVLITMISLSIVFSGCTSVKSSVTTKSDIERIKDSLRMVSFVNKRDTIKETIYKTITKPIHTVIEIPIDCDEYGNVKEIKYKTGSGGNYSSAEILNNKLIIDNKTDSIVNSKEQFYKSFYSTKVDSLSRVIDTLKESKESTEIVKEKGWFFAHLKCVLIISALLLSLGLVLRYK